MRALPPLNALKAFEAAGRHLNFRLAAQELGVTQGAVAQQVRGLEAQLQVPLFQRKARGLALTEAGRRLLAPVRRAFDMIAEATEQLAARETVVTISTTPSFATRWLVPRLGALTAAHPEIRVRIDASDRLANFQSDGVDIAIREGRAPFGPGLVAEPLFPSDLIAVCHPDLATGPQPLRQPEDLRHHLLLQDAHGRWPLFLEQVPGAAPAPPPRRMNFSLTSLAIEAAIARQGVALAPRALVAEDLESGRLCQPFPQSLRLDEGFHLVAPRAPRQPALVETLRAWFRAEAAPRRGSAEHRVQSNSGDTP